MNWKRTGIKMAIAIVIAVVLQSVGNALDVGLTNEMALMQMQNTSATLITNQGFNKIMAGMDLLMIIVLGLMFSQEAKYIYKQLFNKGE